MRAYAISVIFISACHVYISILNDVSPLNLMFLIFILSPFLPFVWKEVSKISFDGNSVSLERIRDNVNLTIERATHKKNINPKSLDELFKTVELNDWMTLVLARMLMRQGLVCLYPNHGLGPSPSLSELICMCRNESFITENEAVDLEKLRHITFYAEWWDGDIPNHGDWQWALENCRNIIRNIFDKQPII
ncbi:hypothetical protein RF663_13465 [Aeromonas veronii]|uniref:hypothetical protein n=1 Tax=Aeromonas veronii TaxID=654 RepID=UPI00285312CE|nr:hypothetical protein [Aeromonas veronii]MDR5015232.1 hypothetical protein [Aeromonas veronii]